MSKRKARPIILEAQGYKCLMCSQKFSKYVPHEIHHIDHDTKNNTLSNFAALCCNCHSAIHRYKIPFPNITHEKNLENIK